MTSRKSRAKQSRTDRLKRLNEGRCPVHGMFMGQVDCLVDANYDPINENDEEEHPEPWFIPLRCCRKGCRIEVRADDVRDGPWVLAPEVAYLLDVEE